MVWTGQRRYTAAKLQRGGRLVKYREGRMQDWLGSGPESRTLAPRKPKSAGWVGEGVRPISCTIIEKITFLGRYSP